MTARTAAQLRDRTIKEIYAVGLTLHGLATRLGPEQQETVLQIADRLDSVIKDMSVTVFDLQDHQVGGDRTPPGGVGGRA